MTDGAADSASLKDALRRLRDENEALRRELDAARAEAAVARKLERDLKALIENTDDFVLFSDEHARPVIFNQSYAQAMKEMLGIEMKPGLQPHSLLDAEGRAFWDGLHARVLAGEKFKAEFPFQHQGRMRHFEIAYNPVFDGERVVGFSEYTREITERKLAEQKLLSALDRSQHDYEAMFKGMLDGFAVHELVMDEHGTPVDYRFLAVNPAFEKLTGLSAAAVLGRAAREVLPDIEPRWIDTYAAVALGGEPIRFERYSEGLGKHFEVYAFRAAPRQFATVFQDISARKLLDEQLRRTERLESIGVLAGGIAHDFNNILASLLASIQMTRWTLDPESESARMLDESERACARAGQLTKQLITFARGGKPVKRRLALTSCMDEWVSFALRGSSVTHQLQLAEDLWAVEVDDGQIAQVVHNLVVNAAQAMPGGGTVNVSAENVTLDGSVADGRWEGEQPCVRLTVTDHGTGIPPRLLTRVFDPYFTTKSGGSGLGLATSYSIVRDHGGFLRANSTEGKGSRFEVFLPALCAEAPAPERARRELLTGHGRLLLMDDDPQLRSVTTALLERLGYSVKAVVDGSSAVSAYRAALDGGCRFDAVLLDLTVPGGMGGKETVARLRELDPTVRALVTSGYSTDPVMAQFREHGFHEVVAKPFSIDELAAALRRVLDGDASPAP